MARRQGRGQNKKKSKKVGEQLTIWWGNTRDFLIRNGTLIGIFIGLVSLFATLFFGIVGPPPQQSPTPPATPSQTPISSPGQTLEATPTLSTESTPASAEPLPSLLSIRVSWGLEDYLDIKDGLRAPSFLNAIFAPITIQGNELIAVSIEGGPIALVRIQDFEILLLSNENVDATDLIFSNDGQYLYSGSKTAEFIVWLIEETELIKRRSVTLEAEISRIAVSSETDIVAVGLRNIARDDINRSLIKFLNTSTQPIREAAPYIDSWQSNVHDIKFTGTSIISVGSSAYVRWYRLNDNDGRFDQSGWVILNDTSFSKSVDLFEVDQGFLAVIADDGGRLHLLDLEAKETLLTSKNLGSAISSIRYIPELDLVAAGTEDCFVFLIEYRELEIKARSEYLCSGSETSSITSLDASPNANHLLVTTANRLFLLNLLVSED